MHLMHLSARRPVNRAQRRSPRRARLALAAATLGSSALLGGGVLAAPAMAGFAPVAQCSVSAIVTIGPALTKKAHTVGANIQGTVSNCTIDGNPVSGTGSFFASSLTGARLDHR